MISKKPKLAGKNILQNYSVTILGYGSQGSAQAQNLRDSGIAVMIGLPAKSKSRVRAKRDGFAVCSPPDAVKMSQVISVLIPDHIHGDLFKSIARSENYRGKSFIFAHGLSIAFNLVKLPRNCDIIMIAPHTPGMELRQRYIQNQPLTGFMAVKQNYTGQADKIGRAYAKAIGISSKGIFKSDFRTEAIGDIFGEQAVLCGGLSGLIDSGFITLVNNGHTAESAYLECVHQLDLIVDLVKKYGPDGMLDRISQTAAFGALTSSPVLFDAAYRRKLQALYKNIENGNFIKKLLANKSNLEKIIRNKKGGRRKSILQAAHDKLLAKL